LTNTSKISVFLLVLAGIMFFTNPSRSEHEAECKRVFKQELKSAKKSKSKLEKKIENAMIDLLATPVADYVLDQAQYQNFILFSGLWYEETDENDQPKKKWISFGIFATVFTQIDQNDL
jgi:hypothetical protein